MKLKMTDILTISVVAVISMPVMYMILLFATNRARLEFGEPSEDVKSAAELKTIKHSEKIDSMIASQSKAYMALQKERKALLDEQKKLAEERQRLAIMQADIESERDKLAEDRKVLEKLAEKSQEMEDKRIKQLARVYGAMRPTEAASILETLEDNLIIKIIKAIGDDRQKSKLMAALSRAKAARITRKMGAKVEQL